MFGNLMGDMEARKEKMVKELEGVVLKTEAGDGAVVIEANANRKILNISIDKNKLESGEVEELEDLLLIVTNRVLEMAAEKEAEASQHLIQNILPPGLGDMFGGI